MTNTSKADSTTTMICPTDAVERKDAQTEYFKLDSLVFLVNQQYDWIAPKVVDIHHITGRKHGACEYHNTLASISVPLKVMKEREDIISTWYILHECAHAISVKLKKFVDHGKLFHHILIELMELFVKPHKYDEFIALEAIYKKGIVKRWEKWKNWRMSNDNHKQVFPATSPVFGESKRRASGSNRTDIRCH